jgi:hypothetical protein
MCAVSTAHRPEKSRQTVITAIARELGAFMWAIDKEMQVAKA